MRDILPVTLRESEEQTQPGELAEGDDDWFKPIGRGRETLVQRFARMIAEGTSIDTTAGVKHTY